MMTIIYNSRKGFETRKLAEVLVGSGYRRGGIGSFVLKFRFNYLVFKILFCRILKNFINTEVDVYCLSQDS